MVRLSLARPRQWTEPRLELSGRTGTPPPSAFPTLGRVPTPVGSVPPDPDDPDSWDWGEFDEETRQRGRTGRVLLVGIVVVGLVLLLVINIL